MEEPKVNKRLYLSNLYDRVCADITNTLQFHLYDLLTPQKIEEVKQTVRSYLNIEVSRANAGRKALEYMRDNFKVIPWQTTIHIEVLDKDKFVDIED